MISVNRSSRTSAHTGVAIPIVRGRLPRVLAHPRNDGNVASVRHSEQAERVEESTHSYNIIPLIGA